jgi:O-antigen ligase
VDRAHNLLLDWAITAGLPSLLTSCLLLFLFVIVSFEALRRPLPPQPRALLATVLGNVTDYSQSYITVCVVSKLSGSI